MALYVPVLHSKIFVIHWAVAQNTFVDVFQVTSKPRTLYKNHVHVFDVKKNLLNISAQQKICDRVSGQCKSPAIFTWPDTYRNS